MSYHRGNGYHQEEWDSENDSTWDEDEEDEETKSKKEKTYQHNQQRRAPRDMQNYRHGYPDKSPKPNLQFYQNKIPFEPHGVNIDYIHERWHNEYEMLEKNHNFIQWLFPLQERGVNWLATPLTLSEIELMKKDKKVMVRILESYKLMLGFYGIVLVDADTGMVARAVDNWEDRFHNLDNHTHNNLRITRILKCLGEMGYEKLQAPLVRFFLEETLCNGNLPNVKESALDYFMFTVKEKKERQKLVHFAWVNYKPQEMFIWGPVDKLRKFNPLPREADVPGEVKVQIDSEVSGSMPENRRHGLVRRVSGHIAWPFLVCIRFVNRLFLKFFECRFWQIRGFFRGRIFRIGGEARNEVRINEGQFSVKTEGTGTGNDETVNISAKYNRRSEGVLKSEHERLLKDHESNKAEHKEQDVSADGINEGNMEENEKTTKLGIEVSGRECESKPEDGKRSEDWKLLANVKMQENRQAKENDNGEDFSGKITKDIKSTNLASRNKQLRGTEEEEDDDTEGCEDSDGHANESRTENCSGTQTANAENQFGETKRYTEMSKIEDNGQSLTVGSEDNNGRNTWAQNTLPETDKAAQVVRDDEKTENEGSSMKPVPPFGGKGYYAENAEISKIEGNRESSNVGSKDDHGLNTETQNTLPETDRAAQVVRDDEKTEGERAANVAQLPQYGGERDEGGNFGIRKTEGNRNTRTMGSKDNDGENIRTQNTEQEKDKTEQNEGVDHTREDVSLDPETEGEVNETLKSEGGSRETEDSEIYKGENKQEDDRTVKTESEDSY